MSKGMQQASGSDLAARVQSVIWTTRSQPVAQRSALVDALEQALPGEDWKRCLRDLAGIDVAAEVQALSPRFEQWDRAQAAAMRCAVVASASGQQWLALEDPFDERVIAQAVQRLGRRVGILAASRASLEHWLAAPNLHAVPHSERSADASATRAPGSEGPVVEFVDRALHAGFDQGASDVHFECDRSGVTVKHRLDGVLVRFAHLAGEKSAQEVISRIKVMALLDITERRIPQDGRFRMNFGERGLDLRVSIMPSVHGEDAVLRLLDKAQLRGRQDAVALDLLGFAAETAERIRELSQMPSGMLLVTGPTGSGKTTTVYAALSEINTGVEKLITIEDPVEYELQGVLQIPVNERKGLTFAKGLRSILRHDPDRILVGEIRDAETAEIAVQSALTGHLVFTTVHANSMSDVVGRFRHFGLDMFGFMSALNGVVVQRLLRKLCHLCRRPRPVLAPEALWLQRHGHLGVASLLAATGCEVCHQTGYTGRFVLAEVHGVDDDLRDHITAGAPLSVLKAHAVQHGVRSLQAQAAALVIEGQTTIEEVRRVVGLV